MVKNSYVLTTRCPDVAGIVAAVSGFLAARRYLITDAQHFNDPYNMTSFMRVVFHDGSGGALRVAELDKEFSAAVGERFQMEWGFREIQRKARSIVAVSKDGHCLNSILHRVSTGTLPIQVVGVVSNHQDLRSLAEWHQIPYYYLPVTAGRKRDQEESMTELFEKAGAEMLVLARYMQILTEDVCRYFDGRAINIHHSFLPGFKGARAYHQAHERGVKLIGATAHYVTMDLDEGPIIEQDVARVDHQMSPEELADIGRDLESAVLNRAIRWHAEQRVFRNGIRTVVLR